MPIFLDPYLLHIFQSKVFPKTKLKRDDLMQNLWEPKEWNSIRALLAISSYSCQSDKFPTKTLSLNDLSVHHFLIERHLRYSIYGPPTEYHCFCQSPSNNLVRCQNERFRIFLSDLVDWRRNSWRSSSGLIFLGARPRDIVKTDFTLKWQEKEGN